MKKFKHLPTGKIVEEHTSEWTENYFRTTDESKEYVPGFVVTGSDWQPYPEVLLVTEDGVSIDEPNHLLYGVYNGKGACRFADACPSPVIANNVKNGLATYGIWFSTAAARDEYILENKPVLSVKEVLDRFSWMRHEREEKELKQLAKSKL